MMMAGVLRPMAKNNGEREENRELACWSLCCSQGGTAVCDGVADANKREGGQAGGRAIRTANSL